MSDEHASSGYKGSLANETIGDQIQKERKDTEKTNEIEIKNYPSEGDTTSSGGFGSPTNIYSPRAQRGNVEFTRADRFRTPEVEGMPERDLDSGMREVRRMEHVAGGNSTDFNQSQFSYMGPIYSDGVPGNEEDIEDAIAGGISRYELGNESRVPVDRRGANEMVEI